MKVGGKEGVVEVELMAPKVLAGELWMIVSLMAPKVAEAVVVGEQDQECGRDPLRWEHLFPCWGPSFES